MAKFHHVSARILSPPLPADIAERYKHVRSWYDFLQALKREHIRPIVVFDGEARVPEKEEENVRRRAARELQRQRGEAEATRGERLAALRKTWSTLGIAKEEILRSFKEITDGTERTMVLEDEDEDTLQALLSLHCEATADRENQLYTPNQRAITKEEEMFFRDIVSEASTVVDWDEGLSSVQDQSTALRESHRKRALSVPRHAFEDVIVRH